MEKLPAIQQKAVTLRDYLNLPGIKGPLSDALPQWLSIDRLLRIVFTSAMKQPKILDCTKESLLQAIMMCAQLGIEPILGRGYLIPYRNSVYIDGAWKKVLECQFMPGYQGLVDIARRSGEVKDVFASVVYKNELFNIEYGTDRKLIHKPHLGTEPGEPIGAYAVWELTGGVKPFEFMPLHEINKRRDRSQAYQYAINNPNNKNAQDCPWLVWPEEMMRKTVIKHSAKLQPASIEKLAQAIELDSMAEIGTSQVGMFRDDIGFKAIPPAPPKLDDLGEPIKDEPPLTFDELAKIQPEYKGNEKFLESLIVSNCESSNETVEQFKIRAAEGFPKFWKYFVVYLESAKKDPANWSEQDWADWTATWKNKKSTFVGLSRSEKFLAILEKAPKAVKALHRLKWNNDSMKKHVQDTPWPLEEEPPPPPPEIPEDQKEQLEPIHTRIENSFSIEVLTRVLTAMSINFPHDPKRPEIIYEFLASGLIDPAIMAMIEKKCKIIVATTEDEELTDTEKEAIDKTDLTNDLTDRFAGAILNQAMTDLEYSDSVALEDLPLDAIKQIFKRCEVIKPF